MGGTSSKYPTEIGCLYERDTTIHVAVQILCARYTQPRARFATDFGGKTSLQMHAMEDVPYIGLLVAGEFPGFGLGFAERDNDCSPPSIFLRNRHCDLLHAV